MQNLPLATIRTLQLNEEFWLALIVAIGVVWVILELCRSLGMRWPLTIYSMTYTLIIAMSWSIFIDTRLFFDIAAVYFAVFAAGVATPYLAVTNRHRGVRALSFAIGGGYTALIGTLVAGRLPYFFDPDPDLMWPAAMDVLPLLGQIGGWVVWYPLARRRRYRGEIDNQPESSDPPINQRWTYVTAWVFIAAVLSYSAMLWMPIQYNAVFPASAHLPKIPHELLGLCIWLGVPFTVWAVASFGTREQIESPRVETAEVTS